MFARIRPADRPRIKPELQPKHPYRRPELELAVNRALREIEKMICRFPGHGMVHVATVWEALKRFGKTFTGLHDHSTDH